MVETLGICPYHFSDYLKLSTTLIVIAYASPVSLTCKMFGVESAAWRLSSDCRCVLTTEKLGEVSVSCTLSEVVKLTFVCTTSHTMLRFMPD